MDDIYSNLENYTEETTLAEVPTQQKLLFLRDFYVLFRYLPPLKVLI